MSILSVTMALMCILNITAEAKEIKSRASNNVYRMYSDPGDHDTDVPK